MNEFIQIEEQSDGSWSIVQLRWDPNEQDYQLVDFLGAGFDDYDSARVEAYAFGLDVRDA